MPTIAIVGPAYPHRGGIAHHTNQLINYLLKQEVQVCLFTFFTQYPRILYPGKTQLEPEGTSDPLSKSKNLKIYRFLDSINIFSWIRVAKNIIHEKPDYCLMKYWHPYFVPCFSFIAYFLRRKKIPVIIIIDNLLPHERHLGDLFLIKILISQTSGVVTQSDFVHKQFKQFFTAIPEIKIPHPIYDQFGEIVSKERARKCINILSQKKLLLFFGFIRHYKGLDILIKSMPKILSSFPDVHLLIAGECFGSFDTYQKLIDEMELQDHITLKIEYIENSQIPYYFGAADLLVMPYRSITNSGIENIARVYANDYLLTVGLEEDEIAGKIISKLGKPGSYLRDEFQYSWDLYVFNLLSFLENNKKIWKKD